VGNQSLDRVLGQGLQARRRKQVFLSDWQAKLDEFLRFNDRSVLSDPGKVSRELADERANAEYEIFNERRRIAIESQAEQSAAKELEEMVRKLPKRGKPKEE
jgi:hypothetical protein